MKLENNSDEHENWKMKINPDNEKYYIIFNALAASFDEIDELPKNNVDSPKIVDCSLKFYDVAWEDLEKEKMQRELNYWNSIDERDNKNKKKKIL